MNQRLISWLAVGIFWVIAFGGSAFAQKESEAVGEVKKNADAAQKAFESMQKGVSVAQKAQQLAQQFIITDGHIDIPYRLTNLMEDISVRTPGGDFDYVRAKAGGLNAPFMSIYIPARYQETGGAKAFADSLIDLVEAIVSQHPDKFAVATTVAVAAYRGAVPGVEVKIHAGDAGRSAEEAVECVADI